jgi:dipeptidyl aminopeptidase/acylaminoacyl peptidase
MRKGGLLRAWAALSLLAVATACGDSTGPRRQDDAVDLQRLFAPPTAGERAAVEADWAARAPSAQGVRVEASQLSAIGLAPMQLQVVSHVVDGHRHYGAILTPVSPVRAALPLVLYLHGGDEGVSVDEVAIAAVAAGVDPNAAVWVVPSFRAEPLRAAGQLWQSGGTASPWDRDVDDTLALLDVAASLVPTARRACVGSIGFSRGGGVALLLSARDTRVRATVEFFGPTDFFGPFVREVVEEVLRGRPRALPGLGHLSQAWVQPLRQGLVSYEEVRLEMLRRSPAHFAERLGPVQLHHGTADAVVPVSQAESLIDAMARIDRGAPAFESYLYVGAGHNPFMMQAAPPRVRSFLDRLNACPA